MNSLKSIVLAVLGVTVSSSVWAAAANPSDVRYFIPTTEAELVKGYYQTPGDFGEGISYVKCINTDSSVTAYKDSPLRNSAVALDGATYFWEDHAAPSEDKCYWILKSPRGVTPNNDESGYGATYNYAFPAKRLVVLNTLPWKTTGKYFLNFINNGVFFNFNTKNLADERNAGGMWIYNNGGGSGANYNMEMRGTVNLLGYTNSGAVCFDPCDRGNGNLGTFDFNCKMVSTTTSGMLVGKMPSSGKPENTALRGVAKLCGELCDTSKFTGYLKVDDHDLWLGECGLKLNSTWGGLTLMNGAALVSAASAGKTAKVNYITLSNAKSDAPNKFVLSPISTLEVTTLVGDGSLEVVLDLAALASNRNLIKDFPVLKVPAASGITKADIAIVGTDLQKSRFLYFTEAVADEMRTISVTILPNQDSDIYKAEAEFDCQTSAGVPYGESQMVAEGAKYWTSGKAPHADQWYYTNNGNGRSPMADNGANGKDYVFEGGLYVQNSGVQWKTLEPSTMSFPNGYVVLPKSGPFISSGVLAGNPKGNKGVIFGNVYICGYDGAPSRFICSRSDQTGDFQAGFAIRAKLVGVDSAWVEFLKNSESDPYRGYAEISGDGSEYFGTLWFDKVQGVVSSSGVQSAKLVKLTGGAMLTAKGEAKVANASFDAASGILLSPSGTLEIERASVAGDKLKVVSFDEADLPSQGLNQVLVKKIDGVEFDFEPVSFTSREGGISLDEDGNICLYAPAVVNQLKYDAQAFQHGDAWSDGLAPHAGANYIVSNPGWSDWTPEMQFDKDGELTYPKFLGDSLTMYGTLRVMQREFTVDDLRMMPGSVYYTLNNYRAVLKGNMSLPSAEGWVSFTDYYSTIYQWQEVNSTISGVGNLKVTSIDPTATGVPNAGWRLTGDNSAWTGKLWVTMADSKASTGAVTPSDTIFTTLYVDNAASLGGELEAFVQDALTVDQLSVLRFDADVTLATRNRGILFSGKGARVMVEEGKTAGIAETVKFAAPVTKEGKGKLILAAATGEGSNGSLNVLEGTVKAANAKAFNGLAVTFGAGTTLAVDVRAMGESGLIGVALSAEETINVALENVTASDSTLRVALYTGEDSEAVKSLISLGAVDGYRKPRLEVVGNTVYAVATSKHSGLMIIAK